MKNRFEVLQDQNQTKKSTKSKSSTKSDEASNCSPVSSDMVPEDTNKESTPLIFSSVYQNNQIYDEAVGGKLKKISDLCFFYNDMQRMDVPRNDSSLLKMKYDLIVICETLLSLKVYQLRAVKDNYYYKLIQEERVDPINVIRHGIVHFDFREDFNARFDFYKTALSEFSALSILNDFSEETIETGVKEMSKEKALNFEKIKQMDLYKKFDLNYRKPDGITSIKRTNSVAHITPFNHVAQLALQSALNHIYEIASTAEPPKNKAKFRKLYPTLLISIAEAGEILSQVRNHQFEYDSSDTPYVTVNRKKIELSPEVINIFIEARQSLYHYSMFQDRLKECMKAVDFVNHSFGEALEKSAPSNTNK